MGLLNDYSNSHFSDRYHKSGDFVLSGVTKNDLTRYGIKMKVKDFKNIVKKSNNFKIVLTGGGLNYRKTRVYNYNNFKNIN